jgi:hypothetical protein
MIRPKETPMLRLAACVAAALALAPTAAAAGPYLGTLDGGAGVSAASGDVSYVTHVAGSTTTLAARGADGQLLRSRSLPGSWGIPRVTVNGVVGGLSADGRLLILADASRPSGTPRAESRFQVVTAKTLEGQRTIRLRGDFGFDALSPDARTLYLIEHVDGTSYRVRAYDLRAGRLLQHVIADKRQRGWVMSGLPVARATSDNGNWVYTLYYQPENYPFVHALDAAHRTAVCIGLPWNLTDSQDPIINARLRLENGRLSILTGAGHGSGIVLDTKTLRILASR